MGMCGHSQMSQVKASLSVTESSLEHNRCFLSFITPHRQSQWRRQARTLSNSQQGSTPFGSRWKISTCGTHKGFYNNAAVTDNCLMGNRWGVLFSIALTTFRSKLCFLSNRVLTRCPCSLMLQQGLITAAVFKWQDIGLCFSLSVQISVCARIRFSETTLHFWGCLVPPHQLHSPQTSRELCQRDFPLQRRRAGFSYLLSTSIQANAKEVHSSIRQKVL